MKFYQSIRWQLQIWYAFILLLALSVSGLTAFYLHRSNAIRTFDQEIERTVSRIQNLMSPHPSRGDARGDPIRDPMASGRPPHFGHPRDMPQELPAQRNEASMDADNSFLEGYTYACWDLRGNLTQSSGTDAEQLTQPQELSEAFTIIEIGSLRGCYHSPPSGGCIIAARDIETMRAEILSFAWLLAASGAIIWTLGLTGGWWLSKQVVAPIKRISSTAKSIADGRLSERIPADRTEGELSELTLVLNQSFDTIETHIQEQTQFTADASHELRTPVTSLLTNTQTALLRDRTKEDYKETIEVCQRAGQRMHRLIDSLLALTRIDSDKFQNTQQAVDLNALLGTCVKALNKTASEKSLKLTIDAEEVTCDCDPDQILQVLTNVIGNAIAYTPIDGDVQVSLKQESSNAVIVVTDNGLGIKAEDVPNIFKRFYRADKSRTGSGAHTGLGLAISESIIRSHNGTIKVKSVFNEGTQFLICLPMHQ